MQKEVLVLAQLEAGQHNKEHLQSAANKKKILYNFFLHL